jgi:hypothetical protein
MTYRVRELSDEDWTSTYLELYFLSVRLNLSMRESSIVPGCRNPEETSKYIDHSEYFPRPTRIALPTMNIGVFWAVAWITMPRRMMHDPHAIGRRRPSLVRTGETNATATNAPSRFAVDIRPNHADSGLSKSFCQLSSNCNPLRRELSYPFVMPAVSAPMRRKFKARRPGQKSQNGRSGTTSLSKTPPTPCYTRVKSACMKVLKLQFPYR